MATAGALPILRKRSPDASFRLPGGQWVAGAAIVLLLWLASNATLREARDTAIAAGVGFAIFGLHRGRSAQH
jgi:hypothetical protein